jgi:hypothetical protein
MKKNTEFTVRDMVRGFVKFITLLALAVPAAIALWLLIFQAAAQEQSVRENATRAKQTRHATAIMKIIATHKPKIIECTNVEIGKTAICIAVDRRSGRLITYPVKAI